MREHFPNLFCLECQAFLTPGKQSCSVQCQREETRFPLAGEALWQARVAGAVHHVLATGDLVLFSYGERRGAGGVSAFQRADGAPVWTFPTTYSVESGLAQFDDCIFFATCGFMDAGAELYCLRLDGSPAWKQPQPLPAGAWSKPVVDESRVYLGLDNGQIYSFDRRTGHPIALRKLSLPRGKLWLLNPDEKSLIVLSKSGQVMDYSLPGLGQPLWASPIETGCEISSAPCLANGKIFFGGRDGNKDGVLLALDLKDKKLSQLAKGLVGMVATPLFAQGLLWVGAMDHHLYAFNPADGKQRWKSPEKFEHSIAGAPCAGAGFLAVGVNDYGLLMFNMKSFEQFWTFRTQHGVRLFSEPLIADGVVYFGADQGQVFALPWHLGYYQGAAEHLKKNGELHEAGLYFAMAARLQRLPQERGELQQKAEDCWEENGEPEWSARMWEALMLELKAADAYHRAAENQRGNNEKAAEYYDNAARLYTHVGESIKAENCAAEAAKHAGRPLLRLKVSNNPRMTQGQQGLISLRATNLGGGRARDLSFLLSGSLSQPVSYAIEAPLDPEDWFDITLPIIQTRQKDELQIEVAYRGGTDRKNPFTRQITVTVEAEDAPIEVAIGDMVMGKINILGSDKRRIKVTVGDVVDSEINIGAKEPVEAAKETSTRPVDVPDYAWPPLPAGLQADEQILIRVMELREERFIVPNYHWAVFLADEAAIDKVHPGPHLRGNYQQLSENSGDIHKPLWKAALFKRGAFRVMYRLGPFRTREKVSVYIECGLTIEMDDDKPFDLWQGILGEKAQLGTSELARWLRGEVSGALQEWFSMQPEENLSAAFAFRDNIMLSLDESLKQTHARYGISLRDPLYYLNFIIPGREQVDNKLEEVYWQDKMQRAAGARADCSHCAESRQKNESSCEFCGKKL
jgi:outer membrane protein assembly factor BamB